MGKLLRYVLIAGVGAGSLYVLFVAGAAPVLQVGVDRPGVGRGGTHVTAHASATRGVTSLRVEAIQGERAVVLDETTMEAPAPWAFWRERAREAELDVELGPTTFPQLSEGHVTLRVSAAGAGATLRGPRVSTKNIDLPVRLTPPQLDVTSRQNYAAQGGSGVVVYRIGERALEEGARDGVQAGEWFFPGRALGDSDPATRFALYGVPYELSEPAEIRLVAEDNLGNAATIAFVERFFPRPLATDTINLSTAFFEKVVPEILARTPELSDRGDLLGNYLAINGELRARNAAALVELGKASRETFLWSDAFVQLPGSQVTSSFADRRTYLFEGRKVDQQDHLGFDLASVSSAPVPAANRGVVVLARYFGIYGNTVVLDHGGGLMSLYSHLSTIDVTEGQEVDQGHALGRTGQTGLAGGDHLHFTTLVRGLPVNPIEWWDPAWVRDRVLGKLAIPPSEP
jgi:murein DD-endopeptidase MepM/ murein hydrolase activator NlpD